MFYKIINNIYLIHKGLLDNNLTFKEIDNIRNKTLFESDEFNLKNTLKSIYQTIYYSVNNLIERIKISNYKKLIQDKKYIQQIIDSQDLDMNDVRNKTELALKNNNDLYYGVMRWISGCCWLNTLITNGYNSELSDLDKKIIYSINKSIELVEPISKPLVLFHGFEKFSNYGEDELIVNKEYTFFRYFVKNI